jgi:hypothetical protein
MNGRAMSRHKPNFFRNTRGAQTAAGVFVCEERPTTTLIVYKSGKYYKNLRKGTHKRGCLPL